ncbi:hypothetical protein P3X46_022978 [Hevea brasiliensis]|uniref:Endonuclease/exonuclease/phosphatase domain-containing protein n=1 Tax=Hevea brasiliensis TaxID=3981 RepID=A0ABQ9LAM6_HEVBR|nr:hypothetical protein P3X46_022978 [Hevea brasiliensis]
MGDFNDLLASQEKQGGLPHPNWLLQGFRQAVEDTGLFNLPMSGYKFTWENGRDSDSCVEEKLDRFLVSSSWHSKFLHSITYSLKVTSSDHLPIYLELKVFAPRRQARLFRYENLWNREPDCRHLVEECWLDNSSWDVLAKLQKCSSMLDSWGQSLHNLFKADIDNCKRDMKLYCGASDLVYKN